MSDLQAIADRFEIEALRAEFTDALMMRDYGGKFTIMRVSGAIQRRAFCCAERS